MKKLIISIAAFLMVTATSCNDDPVGLQKSTTDTTIIKDTTTKKDTVATPEFVGNWIGALPAIPPYINDSVRITVKINKDTSFKLNAIYITSKDTALRDNGLWKTTKIADSIYLNGNDCAVWDTTLKVLKPLATCGDPAVIKIDIDTKANTWKVPMSSLAPLSVAFNIKLTDPLIMLLLPSITITLYKQ